MHSREQAVRFSLRPVFVGWIALVMQLPFQLFFTLWCVFFGGLTKVIFRTDSTLPFWWFGGACLFRYSANLLFRQEAQLFPHRVCVLPESARIRGGLLQHPQEGHQVQGCEGSQLAQGHSSTSVRARNDLSRHAGHRLVAGIKCIGGFGFWALGFGNISASGVNVRDIANPDAEFEKIRRIVDTSDSPVP